MSISPLMSPVIGQWNSLLQSLQWAPNPEDNNPSPHPSLSLLCSLQVLHLPSHCLLSLTAGPFLKHHMSPEPLLTLNSARNVSPIHFSSLASSWSSDLSSIVTDPRKLCSPGSVPLLQGLHFSPPSYIGRNPGLFLRWTTVCLSLPVSPKGWGHVCCVSLRVPDPAVSPARHTHGKVSDGQQAGQGWSSQQGEAGRLPAPWNTRSY